MRRLIEESRRMIRINSVSANGNEELANYIVGLLKERGLKSFLQPVPHSVEDISKRQFNVVGILGDPLVDKKTRKGLLLSTHLDTSSSGLPENWTENLGSPLEMVIKEGRIFGLGVAGCKLDFLCKLHAIERCLEKKLKLPIYLVGTCAEECGMFGVKYLVKSLALNPKYVMVGEPTGMRTVYSHKYTCTFHVSIGFQMVERDARGFNRRIDLSSFGRCAHGAYPAEGHNALTQLIDLLRDAQNYGFDMRFTRIEGGDAPNKVPDHALARFFVTSHHFEDFKRFYRDTVLAENKEKAFRLEFGGLGEAGVRFLPEKIFPCLMEITGFFRELVATFDGQSDPSFTPPTSTVNLEQIVQKTGSIDLSFDIRLLPQSSPEELEKRIREKIKLVATAYPHLNVSVVRKSVTPSLNIALDHPLSRVCEEAMNEVELKPEFSKLSTSTEAAVYSSSGYDSLVFGPGDSAGNSHGPNESVKVEDLEKAVDFYERVIAKVCL